MSNAMSLKAKIRNIAKQKNIPAQVILQNYMFERLLVRLSASEYKERFILKGGMLVAAIVGLDNRATMDLEIHCGTGGAARRNPPPQYRL